MICRIQLLIICLAASVALSAQHQSYSPVPTETTYAKKIGTVNMSAVIADSKAVALNVKNKSRRDFKKPKNFVGRFPSNEVMDKGQNKIADPVRQSTITPRKRPPLDISVNIEGLTSYFFGTASSPADPSGDAGINHYMQGVNATVVGIYEKSGELVDTILLDDFWETRTSAGDPIILFDQEAKRWFITEFPFGNELLIAVSETDDPFGVYNQYIFSTPRFPDYPKYSLWPGSLVVTTNESGPFDLISYFIDLEALYAGEEEPKVIRTQLPGPRDSEQGFIVATPVDLSGLTRPPADQGPIIAALQDKDWGMDPAQTEDGIAIHMFEVDYNSETAGFNTQVVSVSEYDSYPCSQTGVGFSCVPQPGPTGLDAVPEIIYFQPHYRNFGTHESIVLSFVTDVTAGNNLAGVRWTELRRIPGEDWALYQEGTLALSDGLDRYMGGIAMDGLGNIALAYNTSSNSEFVDLRMTGRSADDPLGEMTEPETILAVGQNSIISGGRFGDYAHMTIDPVDDRTFWLTSEYADKGETGTRIVAFSLAKAEFDIYPTALLAPDDSPNLTSTERINVEIINNGRTSIENFKIGYQVDGGPVIEETLSFSLAPERTYIHTFNQLADFSDIGTYNLKLFTSATEDIFISNDTINEIVSKLAQYDASVTAINGVNGILCGADNELSIEIQNLGTEPITDVSLTYTINGMTMADDLSFSGSLLPGESTSLPLPLTDLSEGMTQITVEINQVNGRADQLPDNNSETVDFEVILDAVLVRLELLTDDFPEETSWEIRNEMGNIIYDSDGLLDEELEFTVLTEEFCLIQDECYTFIIYDIFGDGLTAQGDPPGSYQIINEDGEVIVSIINAGFGDFEANEFCPAEACNLEADIITEITGDLGLILIDVSSGAGPDFNYSIDGGISFTDDNIFENLSGGQYEIVITDAIGCTYAETIDISTTSVLEARNDIKIELFPNPTDGLFNILINGIENEGLFLPIQLYDMEGKVIQTTHVTRYDNSYKGMVSLFHYPEGTYLVRIITENDSNILMPIIRQ